jgi:hypothetical protein
VPIQVTQFQQVVLSSLVSSTVLVRQSESKKENVQDDNNITLMYIVCRKVVEVVNSTEFLDMMVSKVVVSIKVERADFE